MRTQTFSTVIVLLLILSVIGANFLLFLQSGSKAPTEVVTVTGTATTSEYITPEEPTLDSFGSLFMIGHWANTPVASTTALIKEHQVAGVIIMSAPENTEEILTWVAEWNEVSKKPLLIAIDQEGGPVNRLKGSEFTQIGQRAILTREKAYLVGLARGKELASLGINMNFAPVLDIAVNPDSFMYGRVFPEGTDAAVLGSALAQGMKDAGVIAVAKHFPGHDDTSDDSHFTLPTVSISLSELPTFTKTFADYITLSDPQVLMTAHVLFPEIDDMPATLSSLFLTDYLRKDLGFKGVIVTDDMSMDAIDTNWSVGEASVLSLKAGADLILLAAEPQAISSVLPEVKSALIKGDLEEFDIKNKSDRNRSLLESPLNI